MTPNDAVRLAGHGAAAPRPAGEPASSVLAAEIIVGA